MHAHRCILVARCEPLARMLESGMREGNRDATIPIPNVSYRVRACVRVSLFCVYVCV